MKSLPAYRGCRIDSQKIKTKLFVLLEVLLLRLVTLAIFTACYLSAALATPNLDFASTAMADEAPFHLNYSPLDLDYGKDIDLLFGELSK